MRKGIIIGLACVLLAPAVTGAKARPSFPKGIKHVVIVGIDGLSVAGLEKAETPHLDALAREGAAGRARTVIPSSSAPNWASMLMGAAPEAHGVTSNDWRVDRHDLAPAAADEKGFFPTVTSVLRVQRPDAKISLFYHWGGIAGLFDRSVVTAHGQLPTDVKTAVTVATYLREERPLFLFTQLDEVDGVGHKHGHMTPAYLDAVHHADSLVGLIVDAIREAGIERETLLIVISDHGGMGNDHGGLTPEEMTVPYILHGAGVKRGYTMPDPAYVYDLAPTVTFSLGLLPSPAWRGQALRHAFKGFEAPVDPLVRR